MHVLFVLVVVALALLPIPAAAQEPPPSVTAFSPTGVVKNVRQVTARFSVPVVPLGDPRPAADVFDIQCAEPGVARWIDSRDWAYDFARDVPAGVQCVFRLRPGFTALDGRPVGGPREFRFSTGGPAITRSWPYAGHSAIDEEQAFVLALDGAAVDASVLQHVSFTVGDRPERIGVRILTGEARQAILATYAGRALRDVSNHLVVIQARQRFPQATGVRLVWGAGVAAQTGVTSAQDQILEFQTRRAFAAEFRCEREQRNRPCLPLTPMHLDFSAPIPRAQVEKLALVGPGGERWRAETRDLREPLVSDATFRGPFPENAAFRVEIPPDLRDDAGRALVNAARFPLEVKTGAFPPLAKFPARFGIIERADPVLPITVRRLEPEVRVAIARVDERRRSGLGAFADRMKASILRIPPEYATDIQPWLRRVATAKREGSVFGAGDRERTSHPLPRPHGTEAFEVAGLPLGKPGLYIVELESARLGAALIGEKKTMYVPAAALVTNLSVHFKWGSANALAWVTALDTGRPVQNARVTVQDCSGARLWRGHTDAQGIARITGLPASPRVRRCGEWDQVQEFSQSRALAQLVSGLLVVAQTPDDLGFVHSSWQDGLEPWRFGLREAFGQRGALVHTIFDRPLYRAGETVHMKHVLRTQTMDGFGLAPETARPSSLFIEHVGSDERVTLPLAWDAAGIAESTWTIPRDAKLGQYAVSAGTSKKPGQEDAGEDGDDGPAPNFRGAGFRVEEFRLPFMRATLRPPAAPQVGAREIPVDLGVQYLAGGPARNLPVVLRTQIQPRGIAGFQDFEGFAFANGAVTEGIRRRDQQNEDDDEEGGETMPRTRATPAIHQRDALTLDQAGTGRVVIRNLPALDTPRDLLAELEFRDPAGEVQTVATRMTLWTSSRLVGVKPRSTTVFGREIAAQIAVVDLTGRAVAGAPVRVEAFERRLYSHRKRLVGGFYAYEHTQETKRLGEVCRGETGAGGTFVCETTAPVDGQIILQATGMDTEGRVSVAHHDIWVVPERSWWWFEARDSDRIDLIPERRFVQPGETARLEVRMPFREATALVSVEREGVIDAFVTPLSGRAPIVEVPVRAAHAPNAFVSVLVVRGRVGDPQPTATVDLGRPAFKLGVAELRVGWQARELAVKVTTPQTVYRVRERVPVTVVVRTAAGAAPPAGSEIALAAVDEGLLELSPNASWDILESMMRRRGYGVHTMTAQMHVVGKRHFGLKAVPSGGGGGRRTTRELFDTLLLWKARVPLDPDGRATIEVPLNDSLTSFRIVAVATGGVDTFGTGATSIRATQDLMILPGLAPLVREGDRFRAETTVRNTTDSSRPVAVTARVDGLAGALEPRTIALAPGEAAVVAWDVAVPAGPSSLRWEIEAAAGALADRVVATQSVVSAVPVRTYQATITQWEGRPVEQAVERPAGSVPGRGGVDVALRPTLLEGLDPLRAFMRRYPYTCLEQRVSVAVALRDRAAWDALARAFPSHLDGDGLLKYFPGMFQGSDVLTSYVLAIAHEAGWPIDDGPRERMTAGLANFVRGKIRRGSIVPAPDLTLRKLAAIDALSRYGAAHADMVSTLRIEPNLWPTSGVLDWWSILRRLEVADRQRRRDEAERIVRARLTLGGTTLGFSTERGDRFSWLMVSPDTNAVRLILAILDAPAWKSDVPRIVRAAVARQHRGAWDLTTSNAWGVLALEKFSAAFERDPVAGTSAAALVGRRVALDWASAARGGRLSLPWPDGREDLRVTHEGTGRPWITIETSAALPLATPLEHGYKITRTMTPVEQRQPGRWSRGDVARVRLTIEAQNDMAWVVVDDPVPGGTSHIGRGLGRESTLASQGEQQRGDAWLAYDERRFDRYRAYYAWVPKGTFVTEYTVRLNQAGRFVLPPTRVEALYAPETFAERPNAALEIEP